MSRHHIQSSHVVRRICAIVVRHIGGGGPSGTTTASISISTHADDVRRRIARGVGTRHSSRHSSPASCHPSYRSSIRHMSSSSYATSAYATNATTTSSSSSSMGDDRHVLNRSRRDDVRIPFPSPPSRHRCHRRIDALLGRSSPSSSCAFAPLSPPDVDDDIDVDVVVNDDRSVESADASASTSTTSHPFSTLVGLHPSSLHAIQAKMKLVHMTEIQHGTFEAARSGRDVLGRARTGTGKTLAFLLPALESALRSGRLPGPICDGRRVGGGGGGKEKKGGGRTIGGIENDALDDGGTTDRRTTSPRGGRGGIAILILSPTRELAMQIHAQAQLLTSSHTNGHDRNSSEQHPMISQVMYGGTSRHADLRKLEDNMPYVLIATPGRLIDHIRTSDVRGTSFADLIRGVSVWVLDEADRCLDMGFRNDMEYILDHKPRGGVVGGGRGGRRRKGRDEDDDDDDAAVVLAPPAQTLLFSATLPKELRSIMASHMREDYLTVDCVRDVDPTTHTNANVDQAYVTLPSYYGGDDENAGRFISGLVDIVEDVVHVTNPTDYKIVVFFPTTAMCEFFSHVFNAVYRVPVLEIHSKKKQSNRTTTSDKFRKSDRGILFTTDVSARGVDYPNVTHVLQYGSAENRETYIHRLGRTGRAGRVGRGILICVTPGEERQFVRRDLGGLDVRLDDRYQRILNGEVVIEEGETKGGGMNGVLKRREVNAARLRKVLNGIGNGDDEVLQKMGNGVYRSLLGYNMTKMSNLGLTRKEEVVAHVNSMAMQMGYGEGRMPRLSPKIVQTLGLVGVRGVNVGGDGSDYEDYGVSGRSFHDRGGAGGGGSSRGRFGDRGRGGGERQGRGKSRQVR